MPYQLGFFRYNLQLAIHRIITKRQSTAHEDAFFLRGGEFIADTLANHFTLKLRETQQDIQRQTPHGIFGVKMLGDGYKAHIVLVKNIDHLGKVRQRA